MIKPAIEEVGLEPYRVDLSQVADSIPPRILEELRTARLVFGDITSENGLRNANVMYELGIAHAIRRPEEVLVFRSDNDRLPFDIAPIFADSYHPDAGPGASVSAKNQVVEAIRRALSEIDLTRHMSVQRIVDALDVTSFEFLAKCGITPFTKVRSEQELGDAATSSRAMAGFSRLLSLGVLQTTLPDFIALREHASTGAAAAKLKFSFTPLGVAVAEEFGSRFYGRRTPAQAFAEFLRVEIARLQEEFNLSADSVAKLMASIAAGGSDSLGNVRELAAEIGARQAPDPSSE